MSFASRFKNGCRLLGIDVTRLVVNLRGLPRFGRDCRRYRKLQRTNVQGTQAFPLRFRQLKPILIDYSEQAGMADGHYFYQDIWAAKKIFEARPSRHVDIGSRIDGFIAHLLCFMPVEVIDIRPLTSEVEGLTFIQADATNLQSIADQSVESLSSLHAVEHFGLGRYTDPIDPDACFAAMRAMQRVLRPGGRLYFSVPIGRQRVEFNAHRIFAPDTVIRTFNELSLRCFSAVDDGAKFKFDCRPEEFAAESFACGMFEFTRNNS